MDSAPLWFMTADGPAGERLARLGWPVLITFLIVTAVMWGLLFWVAVRRRGTLAEHAPPDTGGGLGWVLVGGFAIPVVILAVFFVMTLRSLAAFPMPRHADDPEIRVTGLRWWWDVEYLGMPVHLQVRSPNEIHIPVGRPVDIALESHDVIHSFWVPRLHGKVDLVPGMTNRIRVQADRPGIYRGRCAEYCGLQHAHMLFDVIAHPEDEFREWLAAQRQPARTPGSPSAREGQRLFMASACVLCHTVRGTPAQGRVGPELTHLASRRRIAGGMLWNRRADLQAWVTHAQSLKPGAQMPDLAHFTGDELNALVDYLQSLE
ncbi:MAG TPA: cytochrome c oxidase subunit II [Methylomirabilota bacterium]